MTDQIKARLGASWDMWRSVVDRLPYGSQGNDNWEEVAVKVYEGPTTVKEYAQDKMDDIKDEATSGLLKAAAAGVLAYLIYRKMK